MPGESLWDFCLTEVAMKRTALGHSDSPPPMVSLAVPCSHPPSGDATHAAVPRDSVSPPPPSVTERGKHHYTFGTGGTSKESQMDPVFGPDLRRTQPSLQWLPESAATAAGY
jgi:hypothetical protein